MSLNAIYQYVLYILERITSTHREDGSVTVNAKDMNWIHENVQAEKQTEYFPKGETD